MRGNKLLKLFDRYIGIPLVFLLGIIRFKQYRKENNSIAFLMTAALGDTLLFSSLVKELKSKHSEKKLVMFCGNANKIMVDLVGGFDEVVPVSIKNPLKAIATLRKYQFDIFIDCGQWPRLNAILTYFSRSNYKIGFKTKGQHKHYVYDLAIEHKNNVHEEENFKKLLSPIDENLTSRPRLEATGKLEGSYCIFHLCPSGERSYLKEWPIENWVELSRFVLKNGFSIYLTGGPVDFEKNQRLIDLIGSKEIINLAGKTNLAQVTNYLSSAKFIVSVNTGIMHMAAAVKVPLIALHGPTDPKRWGPLSESAKVVSSKLECSPCLNLGFEYGCDRNDCMKSLKAEYICKLIEVYCE